MEQRGDIINIQKSCKHSKICSMPISAIYMHVGQGKAKLDGKGWAELRISIILPLLT